MLRVEAGALVGDACARLDCLFNTRLTIYALLLFESDALRIRYLCRPVRAGQGVSHRGSNEQVLIGVAFTDKEPLREA
jgi:hypothetical protein